MLYFDEAGNSGDNLLDEDQPCYLLLSHNFSEKESMEILKPLLEISKANELHFKTVKKYSSRQNVLLECFNNPVIAPGRVHYYVAHKPFMVTIHIVDRLIEPVMYNLGIDMYKNGLNLSTANIIYLLGTNKWDYELFKQLGISFIQWTKTAETKDGEAFYAVVEALYNKTSKEDGLELIEMILTSQYQMEDIANCFEKFAMDATLSCLVEHCHYWSGIYSDPFEITCDNSKQIDHWRSMIQYLNRLPATEVGFGSRKHRYPLQIKSLQTADSTASIQLQLSDLMASYINHYFINLIKNQPSDFSNAILNTRLSEIIGNQMWPSTNVTPESLNMTDTSGQNPLDFLADNAQRNPEEYAKLKRKRRRDSNQGGN